MFMSEKENYNLWIANLPFDETRDYLGKIIKRRAQYQE